MGTAGAYNCACSNVEQSNSDGEWEALTSFHKNKQIRTGGEVKGEVPVNLIYKTLKSTMPHPTIEGEPKEELKPITTVKKRREGRK